MEFISKAYLDLCSEMHQSRPWGMGACKYLDEFLPFLKELNCTTLLDYGCGRHVVKAPLAELFPKLSIFGYDPALPEYADLPDPAQFVLGINVMEHVEEPFVVQVLEHVCSLTQVGAFFNIGMTRSKKVLPDGRNAHITLQSHDWWLDRINALPWKADKIYKGKKSLRLWITK